jgi:NAD(P)-dependent dehydrogenase (short-subunit alcohol dehydrogenase family)
MPSVLVTGANRGLGLEFVRQYALDRWTVLAACRDPARAKHLTELAGTAEITVLPLDVTDASSARRAAATVSAPVDVLINCAGIMGENSPPGEMNYDSWLETLNVNTLGPYRIVEAFLGHLVRGNRKLIVTITSGMGSLADNTSGRWIPYRSSKAAVNMVMRSLAIDLAPRGVTSVVMNPGWVRTDMGGPNATLSPKDSVAALRRTIDTLGPDHSGKFYNLDGREFAW